MKAPESWTLVLVAAGGAGRRKARKRAGGALPTSSRLHHDITRCKGGRGQREPDRLTPTERRENAATVWSASYLARLNRRSTMSCTRCRSGLNSVAAASVETATATGPWNDRGSPLRCPPGGRHDRMRESRPPLVELTPNDIASSTSVIAAPLASHLSCWRRGQRAARVPVADHVSERVEMDVVTGDRADRRPEQAGRRARAEGRVSLWHPPSAPRRPAGR